MGCIIWEVKISKCENYSKWGPKRWWEHFMIHDESISYMASKFISNNIWPSFWPNIWPPFGLTYCFGQRGGGVKCYSIWILRPDLESCHHLTSFRTPFNMILHAEFLTSHVYNPLYNWLCTHLKIKIFEKKVFWMYVFDV